MIGVEKGHRDEERGQKKGKSKGVSYKGRGRRKRRNKSQSLDGKQTYVTE